MIFVLLKGFLFLKYDFGIIKMKVLLLEFSEAITTNVCPAGAVLKYLSDVMCRWICQGARGAENTHISFKILGKGTTVFLWKISMSTLMNPLGKD